MRNPRHTARYGTAARAYVAAHRGADMVCALCGNPVDMTAPPKSRYGPTIEHRYPVREILRVARTWQEALDMTCDESMWAIAHRVCQDRQGAAATQAIARAKARVPTPSRVW